jgi:hypothetical protein
MSFAAGRAFDRISPIGGALSRPQTPPEPPPAATTAPRLSARLDAKLAELERAGYRICWMEIGKPELITLFRELGDDAVKLDTDPARDCGWYGRDEVRFTGRDLIWIMLEGEVAGEISMHVMD